MDINWIVAKKKKLRFFFAFFSILGKCEHDSHASIPNLDQRDNIIIWTVCVRSNFRPTSSSKLEFQLESHFNLQHSIWMKSVAYVQAADLKKLEIKRKIKINGNSDVEHKRISILRRWYVGVFCQCWYTLYSSNSRFASYAAICLHFTHTHTHIPIACDIVCQRTSRTIRVGNHTHSHTLTNCVNIFSPFIVTHHSNYQLDSVRLVRSGRLTCSRIVFEHSKQTHTNNHSVHRYSHFFTVNFFLFSHLFNRCGWDFSEWKSYRSQKTLPNFVWNDSFGSPHHLCMVHQTPKLNCNFFYTNTPSHRLQYQRERRKKKKTRRILRIHFVCLRKCE